MDLIEKYSEALKGMQIKLNNLREDTKYMVRNQDVINLLNKIEKLFLELLDESVKNDIDRQAAKMAVVGQMDFYKHKFKNND